MAVREPLTVPLPERLHHILADGYRVGMLQQPDELAQFLLWLEDGGVLPGEIVIEIGSHRGGTACVWAGVVSDLVLAVDLPHGVGGGLTDAELADRDALMGSLHPHVQFVLGNSQEMSTIHAVSRILNGRLADLLFIDGDHRYAAVAADWSNYRGFVRPGGVIAFHDLIDASAEWDLGVSRFFQTLPDPKHTFTIGAAWGGIGAIVV